MIIVRFQLICLSDNTALTPSPEGKPDFDNTANIRKHATFILLPCVDYHDAFNSDGQLPRAVDEALSIEKLFIEFFLLIT